MLKRGTEEGVFEAGVDPLNVYLTIASLGFFYLSNRHTLAVIFGRDLTQPNRLAEWEEHLVKTVLASVKAK